MPYAEVNDIRMYFEEEGQGQPLILLHGAMGAVGVGSMVSWDTLVPDLAARYHAVCIEYRGHGRTNNPSGSLSYLQLADDIGQFIERFNLAPAHLAGVSDGGVVGLALALTRPELLRSFVSIGSGYRVDDRVRAFAGFFDPVALERDQPAFAQSFAARHDPYHYPGYWRELVRQVRANVEAMPAWTEADLRRIPVPTLLIVGECDITQELEQTLTMRRSIPNAEMLILNHAGLEGLATHLPQHSQPHLVAPAMVDFLTRHAGPDAA